MREVDLGRNKYNSPVPEMEFIRPALPEALLLKPEVFSGERDRLTGAYQHAFAGADGFPPPYIEPFQRLWEFALPPREDALLAGIRAG